MNRSTQIIGTNGTTTFLLESPSETIDYQAVAPTPPHEVLRGEVKAMIVKMTDSKTPITKPRIAEFYNSVNRGCNGDKEGLLMTRILSAIYNRLETPVTDLQFYFITKMVIEIDLFLDGFKSQILEKFFLQQSVDMLEKELFID